MSSSGGIGFTGVLAIVFIVLKLVGVIAWSWWWVLSPLWFGLALAIVGAAIFILGNLVFEAIVERQDARAKAALIERRKNLPAGHPLRRF